MYNGFLTERGVIAIRIYMAENGKVPMADLMMRDHTKDHLLARQRPEGTVIGVINGYTLIYNERRKYQWADMVAIPHTMMRM